MITLAMDESGKFEENYKKNLIGGFVYVGEDYDDEEKRLEDFLKRMCIEISSKIDITVEYPKGIHTTDNRNKQNVNSLMYEQVIKYIKENKNYHISFYIKDNNENYNLDFINEVAATSSNLVKSNCASNLYEIMSTKYLYNNLFYNPILEKYISDKINLKLATRVTVCDKNSKTCEELMELGYPNRQQSNSKVMFYTSDSRTYKAALLTKIRENKIDNLGDFSLSVTSIPYDIKNESQKTEPFLYLADILCGYINASLGIDNKDFGVVDFCKEMRNTLKRDVMCFVYDENLDIYWSRVMESFKEGNIVEVLKNIYKIENSNSEFKWVYKNIWIKSIENKLKDIVDKNQLDSYISDIEYFFNKNVNLYEEGLFIAKKLLCILEEDKDIEKYLYKLYDICIRGYNHIGECSKSYECMYKCKNLRNYVSIEEYLLTLNRISGIYLNILNFEKAIDELSYSADCYSILKNAYKDIAELNEQKIEATNATSYAKTLSTLGQAYAFNGEYEKAEMKLLQALNEFENEGDRKPAKTYLMHLYISMKDKKKYEDIAGEFFCSNDLKEQFENIRKAVTYTSYDLYVYVKALNVFYYNNLDIDREFLIKIYSADYEKINGLKKINSHPYELIYRNLALLAKKKGYEIEYRRYMEKAVSCVIDRDFTVKLINGFTNIQYIKGRLSVINKKDKQYDKTQKELKNATYEVIDIIEKNKNFTYEHQEVALSFSLENDKIYKFLEKKLGYMYC